MNIKRFLVIFIIAFLLFSGQVFVVEGNQKDISKYPEIENYLNRILDFHEETLRKIVKNIPEDKLGWYKPLHDDYQVLLEPYDEPFVIIDATTESLQKYIHISRGYLWTIINKDGIITKWEIESEAEIAAVLAHELGHLVLAHGRDVTIYEEEYIEKEVMADVFAAGLLFEEGYCILAITNHLEKYLNKCYDHFKHFVSKSAFQKRIQLVKEIILETLAKFPSNECKEFIIATREEFEQIKVLLKSGN